MVQGRPHLHIADICTLDSADTDDPEDDAPQEPLEEER